MSPARSTVSASGLGNGATRFLPYVLTVGAVLLAWQVVIQPAKQRAPVELAVRIAPGSASVLSRAAESELAAGRTSNAGFLGREALARTPFNVRALRTVGLSEARAGRLDQADQIVTLSGNWSLRDDPSHAWLVERRLRRGDYASAFAHADTLARRRDDIRPRIFELFTTAASSDASRALPVVARLVTANPPWRQAYLDSLYGSHEGIAVIINLAIMMEHGARPFTHAELEQLYVALTNNGNLEAVRLVRERLNRPPATTAITNGAFEDPTAPAPFQWTLSQKSGAIADITDEAAGSENSILRVEYDGFSSATFAQQRTFLTPGRYRLRAKFRVESGDPSGRMAWTVACAGGPVVASMPTPPQPEGRAGDWMESSAAFVVPAGCDSQIVDLRGAPRDSRTPMAAWFDDVSVSSAEQVRPSQR